MISWDYVSDFNELKSLWYHWLHIILDNFRKTPYDINVISYDFKLSLWRFKIDNWKSQLNQFYVISYDCILDFERSGSMISLINGRSGRGEWWNEKDITFRHFYFDYWALTFFTGELRRNPRYQFFSKFFIEYGTPCKIDSEKSEALTKNKFEHLYRLWISFAIGK